MRTYEEGVVDGADAVIQALDNVAKRAILDEESEFYGVAMIIAAEFLKKARENIRNRLEAKE